MAVLFAHRLEPVLPAHCVAICGLHPFGREPVRPLPAELGAEDGAAGLQPVVERRDQTGAARNIFLVREGDRVMLAIGFERAVAHPVAVAVHRRKAADIDRPEIQRRLAAHRPFRQHPAGAAARGDAEGVEAGADEHVGAFRRRAEDEIAVGREAFGAVDHLLHPDLGQRRDAGDGRVHMLGEVVPVVVEQPEFPVGGHVAGGPWLRIRLIAAHDEAAGFLLEIGPPVGIAQSGGVAGQAGDRFGDDVLVLDRLQRHVDARHRAHLPGPLAGAIDHGFAGDRALGGLDMGDAVALHPEPGDAHPLDQPRPVHPRAFGQRLGDVGRVRLPITSAATTRRSGRWCPSAATCV